MRELPSEIRDRICPWSGTAYVHVQPPIEGDLDVEAMSEQPEGRWNDPHEPTLYFAGDPGVALSELARHVPADERATARELLRFRLDLRRMLDVRPAEVCERLGFAGAPFCLLQRGEARALGRMLRASRQIDSLLVPPMAFLEQPERWNLVLFVDRLAEGWLREWASVGTLEVRPTDG